jgi:ABC-type branched-subunit amino acid transport system substrate-binding protein
MRTRLALAGAILALAGVIVAGAWATTDTRGGATATPGVTSSSISIGGTFPLSGEAASAATIAKGADAYFKFVNGRGGVFGRRINFKYVDDGYDPGRAVTGTRQLVLQDKVFAIFGSLGTEQNLATRPILNQLGVPQLFVSSGASTWGRDAKKYPWTLGFIPTYPTEAKILANFILRAQKKPKPRIAILYQNDTYGRDIYNGFKHALGAKKSLIVATQNYDPTEPDVRSEVARLKASKANTYMIFAFGKFAIQAYVFASQLGWHPKTYVNAVASSYTVMQIAQNSAGKKAVEGSISIAFNKDPASPTIVTDAGYRSFKAILSRYDKSVNPKDGYAMYGMSAAYTMVDALRRAGKNLTRQGIMSAATHLNERANPFLLKGIVVHTTPKARFPVSQAKLQRWHNGRWVQFGPLQR